MADKEASGPTSGPKNHHPPTRPHARPLIHNTIPSIPPLPANNVNQPLPPLPPLQVDLQHLERALGVRLPDAADVRRDRHVRRAPQRVVRRQRLGCGDVEGGAPQVAALERGDERRLVDDAAAADVGDEGVPARQDAELGCREQVRRFLAGGGL